jgi:hypothetical protein
LLKPKAPFAPAELAEVAGLFKDKVSSRTDSVMHREHLVKAMVTGRKRRGP